MIREINQKRESAELLAPVKSKDPSDVLIEDIKIEGNSTVSTVLVMSQLSVRIGEVSSEFKIERNVKNIETLGVFSEVSYKLTKTKTGAVLTFKVTENPVVKEIKFPGMSQFKSSEVMDKLKIKVGSVFNTRDLREDIDLIRDLYLTKGYSRAKVGQVDLPTKESPVLTFNILEGIINQIIITGNNKTKDYVILREIDLKPGDALTQNEVRDNIRRIYNLNYFTAIEPNLTPTANGKYDLTLDLTERENNGQFSFGGGYSPQTGFSIFSDLFWDNIMGTGQLILLKGQFGIGGANSAQDSRFQFKYFNPWMWDNRKSLTTRLWRTNGDAISALATGSSDRFRQENRVGMDFTVGLPVNYDFRYSHRIKFEQVELTEVGREYDTSSYTFGLTHDTRDVRFNPRSGHYINTYIENAFNISSRSLEFVKYDVSLKKFIPTFDKQTIALRLDLGLIDSSRIGDVDLFSSEYYRVGFPDSVRGQNQSNFQFGNKKIVSSIEYRFLFTDTFSFVIFGDAGLATLGTTSDISTSDFLIGKGVGIRFLVPGLGPLSVDAGSDEEGVVRVQVNIGHTF
jgi:outer membrane protein insertion porin family